MSEITRYVLVDREDREGEYEYARFDEAKAAAGDDHAVIERTYTYDDSELVWTPDGGNVWPPEPEPEREKGDDDGAEYGDPRDEQAERFKGEG